MLLLVYFDRVQTSIFMVWNLYCTSSGSLDRQRKRSLQPAEWPADSWPAWPQTQQPHQTTWYSWARPAGPRFEGACWFQNIIFPAAKPSNSTLLDDSSSSSSATDDEYTLHNLKMSGESSFIIYWHTNLSVDVDCSTITLLLSPM